MIKLNDIRDEFKKIRLELKVYKPEFKLAKLNSKIKEAEINLENSLKELNDFKNSDKLIDLNDLYVLTTKEKTLFVIKNYNAIKDGIIIDEYQGIYQGFFTDVFTNNVVCYFKQIVNYETETFKTSIISNNYKNANIIPILEYINLNDIVNGKISMNILKKTYSKIK